MKKKKRFIISAELNETFIVCFMVIGDRLTIRERIKLKGVVLYGWADKCKDIRYSS